MIAASVTSAAARAHTARMPATQSACIQNFPALRAFCRAMVVYLPQSPSMM